MSICIREIQIEYQNRPIGLDCKRPAISWLFGTDENDVMQKSCRIRVEDEERVVWDTGILETAVSTGIVYEGEELQPMTVYRVTVTAWLKNGKSCTAGTQFETGLMDPYSGFGGAKWIAAPRQSVHAEDRGVFVIETELTLSGSGKAGIVFGAGDARLMHHAGNEYHLEGDNGICYAVNLNGFPKSPARLEIYRVGYAPDDTTEPLLVAELAGLTEENVHEFHKLTVEVRGNVAAAIWDGEMVLHSCLNPHGNNDVPTYPRLNGIGFYADEHTTAYFRYYRVRNLRSPGRVLIEETPAGGLSGRKGIFADRAETEGTCFRVQNARIVAWPEETALPMLRTGFLSSRGKKLKTARLYITSRGIYDCRINGKEVTARLLPPGITQYDKRMNYQTYDVTEMITEGANGIGVTLASGWWCDAQSYVMANYNYFGDRPALLLRLRLVYEDGTEENVLSDPDTFTCSLDGPYRYAGFFLGEAVDGRKLSVYETYSLPEFDDSSWEKPAVDQIAVIPEYDAGFGRIWPAVHETEPQLIGEYDAPVYIVKRLQAKSVRKLEDGIYIYDMGQEMAGVPRIMLREKKGTRVRIRYAEMLYPDLPRYRENVGEMMVENYRDATSIDRYICSGREGGEIYQPRFTFHGYRYLELSGVTNPPEPEEVIGLQYSSITRFEGSFTSSDPLLNRFAENVTWSQLCNFINIPTDCPQRNERMGWVGDTHVFCRTALMNSHLKLFYERNLQAMEDLQERNGRYPEIAPVGGGFGGITYECASIFIAYELYQQYGDVRTLERVYPALKRYMHYMEGKGLPGKGDPSVVGPLADWLAFQETDEQLMWNAFYYREADLMGKIAEILGRNGDAEAYRELALRIRRYWNQTFVDPETKRTRTMDGRPCDTQCSYALPLAYGVVDDREAAGRYLAEQVRLSGYTVGTGFFGTGVLNESLSETGHWEEACRLMLQRDFPSWLYPVTQGATSIWEHWDSYTVENGFGEYNTMNSFNHYSLGSVLSWLYSRILGIRRDERYPGFSHFILEPHQEILDYAKGSVSSPYGIIESEWNKEDNRFFYSCKIPANASATLILPDGRKTELCSGNHRLCCEIVGLV